MPKVDLAKINVVAELERAGWAFEFAGEEEVRCVCPFHEDTTPSCSINLEKRVFMCHTAGCEAKGDILTFMAKVLDTTRRVIFEDLSGRYDLEAASTINSETVERYHSAIWAAKPMLKELAARGVDDDLIREHRLGYHNGRITIPITNINGLFVNVRRYLPGAPGKDKMKNTRGHGKVRLYPIDQLKYDSIVICGGEIKAIATAHILNEHNIGAVTATAGEGNWETEFSKQLEGKRTWVCFDIDTAGIKAAGKVCARLKRYARWVGSILLPLDIDKHPNGDINDWIAEGGTGKVLFTLLENANEWKPQTSKVGDSNEEPERMHLTEAVKAKHTGMRIRVAGIVAAMDTAPYVVPCSVKVDCDKSQDGCSTCPAFMEKPDEQGYLYLTIPPESPAILEMVAAPKAAQRDAIIAGLGLATCKVVNFIPATYYNVEDVRVSPQLEIANRAADHIMLPALCVGHGLELNEGYDFTGRMYPHPKTQQSVLVISNSTATKDALSSYEPSSEELEELHVFQPDEWTTESLTNKLSELYEDLESNVTRIFMRRDLHLFIDLAYHSVLLMNFDKRVTKGWTEILILGDSAQGKSESIIQIMEHYGLGTKMECKNATVAGLLGGLQQMGTRWFVTWGIIPTHDKRLVTLEELKGTSVEVIGKLTDMRSSGVAEIPKIEKRRTHARTRLIVLSNPRSDQPLSTYNFGVEAISELIGSPEDVRRFDAALLVSASQIDPSVLNTLQRHRPNVEHRHTADLCRRCVLWAWTRSTEQVMFTEDAYTGILDRSTELCVRYNDRIPLVDRGSMRFKVARLATALACRTFSCAKDDCQKVVVRRCHVDFIIELLDRIYSTSLFGYLDYSTAIKATHTLLQPKDIKSKILQTPFPADFIEQMLHTNEIELRDICDWCGWERGDGLTLLSFLVRKHALRRDGRGYRKSPPFIELLKQVRESKEIKILGRPDFIEDTEDF